MDIVITALVAVVPIVVCNWRWRATGASSYAGTAALNFWTWFHTLFAITTIFIWAGLGMIWMLVTGVEQRRGLHSRR